MPMYKAFGLTFDSDIDLPTLLTADLQSEDVKIELGHVSKTGLEAPITIKPFCQVAQNELWLHIPNIGRFYVTKGDIIRVDPDEGTDLQSVRLFLLGSCIGALMYQRNRLVIHGNAIRFGDGCVIFAGKSGNGKSTLAAAFHQRGYKILSDDLSVIDEHGQVQPSYPQLKLWHDTVNKLGIDVSSLNRIRLQVDKYAYKISDSFCHDPLPIKAIYILNTHNQYEFELSPIKGINKFNSLKNNSYRSNYLEGLGLKAKHLELCGQVANKVDITRITRPNDGFKLGELVDLIEADMKLRDGLAT